MSEVSRGVSNGVHVWDSLLFGRSWKGGSFGDEICRNRYFDWLFRSREKRLLKGNFSEWKILPNKFSREKFPVGGGREVRKPQERVQRSETHDEQFSPNVTTLFPVSVYANGVYIYYFPLFISFVIKLPLFSSWGGEVSGEVLPWPNLYVKGVLKESHP